MEPPTAAGIQFAYNVIRVYELEGESFFGSYSGWVAAVHSFDEATC